MASRVTIKKDSARRRDEIVHPGNSGLAPREVLGEHCSWYGQARALIGYHRQSGSPDDLPSRILSGISAHLRRTCTSLSPAPGLAVSNGYNNRIVWRDPVRSLLDGSLSFWKRPRIASDCIWYIVLHEDFSRRATGSNGVSRLLYREPSSGSQLRSCYLHSTCSMCVCWSDLSMSMRYNMSPSAPRRQTAVIQTVQHAHRRWLSGLTGHGSSEPFITYHTV